MKRMLLIITVMTLLSKNARSEISYTVTDLGTFGRTASVGNALNNNGQVVGTTFDNVTVAYNAFVWDSRSGMQYLGVPPYGGDTFAYGINDAGQVVGYYSGHQQRSFIWDNTSGIQDLGMLPGGWYGYAWGINKSGKVVGSGGTSAAGGAYLWQTDTGMQNLGVLPGGTYSDAAAINNHDLVVGASQTGTNTHAFIWQSDSGMQDIGVLAGYVNSEARAINDNGLVVGISYSDAYYPTYHAFLWQSDSGMQEIGSLAGAADTYPNGINNEGVVVGRCNWNDGGQHAFVWQSNTGTRDLNDLIDTSLGWTLGVANGVNDHGQIVGTGSINGQQHAFLLTPTPEPSTFVSLGIGALCLIAYACRRWIHGHRD